MISKEQQIRHRLAMAVIAYLDDNCSQEIEAKPLFRRVKEKYERMAEIVEKQLNGEEQTPDFLLDYRQMLLDIIDIRRGELKKMHRNKELPITWFGQKNVNWILKRRGPGKIKVLDVLQII